MKIRHKLLVLLAVTAALAGLVIGFGAVPLVHSAIRGRYIERLRVEADLLRSLTPATLSTGEAQRLAHEWGERLDVRITLVAPDGRVLGDTSADDERLAQFANHAARPEIRQAAADGWGESFRASESAGEAFYYLARRVDPPGAVGFVRIAIPAWHVRRAQTPYVLFVLLLMGVTPVLLTALAYGAVRAWSRPLEDLAQAAARIAAGDLDVRVPRGGSDEIGAVASALEQARRALGGKIAELDGERRFLASILAGIREGLLLVDHGRRVALANEEFRQIWGIRGDPTGRPLTEVVRHPSVLAAVDRVLADGREIRERIQEIGGAGRAFQMRAGALPRVDAGSPAGVILVFFETTRIEALEALRREFLSNVSHELRTPITSIKAAALTLADGCDPAAQERFVGTIQRNAERMAALIEDLTDLSLIETGAIQLERRPVDVAAVARDIVAQLAPRHVALGLAVDVTLSSPFTVNADRRRLEQILVNLVDNAMKFNRPGGRVTISGHGKDGRAVIVVEDTGTGIPSDQLEMVFHRFHRVDPARSREVGGTGLGLAIVKHLVQLHGGSVRVESELGHGSRFIVEI